MFGVIRISFRIRTLVRKLDCGGRLVLYRKLGSDSPRMTRCRAMLFFVLMWVMLVGIACADSPAKEAYLADCARCHGADGKGYVAAMREVPGYKSVGLTQLSKENQGQFPRQMVYDTIEGRKRFPAHFIGDMPTWGLRYREDDEKLGPEAKARVKRRISALVDYIESIQEK